MPYLFLSGNQRSGKTLLQLMLASHPEVSISPGTNVIARVLYGMRRDRPLDAVAMREFRRTLQKDRKLKAWRVDHRAYMDRVEAYRSVTSREIVDDLMRFFRDQTKPAASYVGNKKGCYCKEADLVKRVFPEARFIFIVRDGRGAVSSMMETQPEHDIVSASLLWTLKARRIRELASQFPKDVFVVRYEELVKEPEAMSRALCRFLELEYSPKMLSDYRTNDATRHATDTTHLETYQAITTSMIDEWKTHLSREQIRVVEGIAGKELARQGYDVDLSARTLPERVRYRLLRARDYTEWRVEHERKALRMG